MNLTRNASVEIRHGITTEPGCSFKIGVSVDLKAESMFDSSAQVEDWLRNRLCSGVAQEALAKHRDPDALCNILMPYLFRDLGDLAMVLSIKLHCSDGSERTVVVHN